MGLCPVEGSVPRRMFRLSVPAEDPYASEGGMPKRGLSTAGKIVRKQAGKKRD